MCMNWEMSILKSSYANSMHFWNKQMETIEKKFQMERTERMNSLEGLGYLLFLVRNNTFIQLGGRLIKSNSKDDLFQINAVLLNFIFIKESSKILSSTTVFNINNNYKYLLITKSALEGFLKNHVTLKTGVMMLKIQLCHHRNTWHFKTY